MEWNIFGIDYHRSTALRINHQLAESLFPPEVAKFSPRGMRFYPQVNHTDSTQVGRTVLT